MFFGRQFKIPLSQNPSLLNTHTHTKAFKPPKQQKNSLKSCPNPCKLPAECVSRRFRSSRFVVLGPDSRENSPMINNNCPTKKKHPNYSRRIIITMDASSRRTKKRTGQNARVATAVSSNRGRNARACIRRRGFRAVWDDRNDQSSASLRLSMMMTNTAANCTVSISSP